MAEYIERNLLKERFRKRLQWLKLDVHDEYSSALLDGCETDFDLIDEIPVAKNVKEIVCAHWIDYQVPHISCCSYCDWGINPLDKSPYCPNCGAEMSEDIE